MDTDTEMACAYSRGGGTLLILLDMRTGIWNADVCLDLLSGLRRGCRPCISWSMGVCIQVRRAMYRTTVRFHKGHACTIFTCLMS
jgi:hypothetical protein